MEIKRQEQTVNSNRHVSPHVLSTVHCGESTNAAVTLPSRSLSCRGGEHRKLIPRTFFFPCLEKSSFTVSAPTTKSYTVSAPITKILGKKKIWAKKKSKVIDFDLFF